MEVINRAYELMLNDALSRIEGKDYEEIAENASVKYIKDKNTFIVPSLGKEQEVNMNNLTVKPSFGKWHNLTIFHYLDLSDGTSLTGKFMPLSDIKDGMIRGSDMDKRFSKDMQIILHNKTEEEFIARLNDLGAAETKTNADYSVILPYFPKYPLLLKVWFADEDFPASAKLMVDANDTYLEIEDAVAVAETLIELLK